MSSDPPPWDLPLRLFLGFRALVDDVHADLAAAGHAELRPMHGFVLQAVGPHGTTAADLGRRLGVSKQAAGKTVDALTRAGYLERARDPGDARRRLVRLTPRAHDALARSAAGFAAARERWGAVLGADRVRELERALAEVTPADVWRLDVPGWFAGS
ncbi:MarR family winged helix-turn-helix transcriptional regulator [Actinomadura atramentaria]|uniref:MarR family winged helix-turn-helix transcriptional regulator n=1 Tax=Actinomadura atramentaria TaxID=1990 RepID=UPI000379D7A5|nr:MarR family winged helix-turn-helix transcriptional regulator [Actinomadura atramentaria]